MGICFERQDYITSQVQQSWRLVFTLSKYQFCSIGGTYHQLGLALRIHNDLQCFYIISGLAATIVAFGFN